ncbi:MAG: hypothetical protein A2X94_13045 [Bdellovibrionales bacterium GWB1_55_8]|nr:MAG: hypothetical protein A2X94_13045 [Bdellovibrionales bacterium GWB1_55_8]
MPFVGTGKSTSHDAHDAGREAALQAIQSLSGQQPGLLLVFGTAGYNQQELLDGIFEIAGQVPLSGCSTSGVITQAGSDESSHAVAVLALSHAAHYQTFQARGFGAHARICAEELSRKIRESAPRDARLLLLFPDGLTGNVTELVARIEATLPRSVKIAGGTSGELLKLNRTWQYHDGRAESDTVSAVLISGSVSAEVKVSHSCEPIGLEQTVTRAEGGWIYEIDGHPAWSVYKQYLDPQEKEPELLSMAHVCYICLAEILPEPDPAYGKYIIRCPLQVDHSTGALFFPGNIVKGTKVRMALRSAERAVSQALSTGRTILARHPGKKPALLLHFDCCCRARLLFGACSADAVIQPLQQLFGQEVPWFGFNTYGEIAALDDGRTLFHNYSTVLCALYLDST